MNELALFAGIGGGILAGKLLGWRTVCAVEINAFCASVLAQRQNDGCLDLFPIWSDVRSFDGKPWRGIIDIISGGFPCQDISVGGHGAGLAGERSGLWFEFARIIREVGPRYVFVENSPAITRRGLNRVLWDLASMGFDARWGVFSGPMLGAPIERERLFIACTNKKHGNQGQGLGNQQNGKAAEFSRKNQECPKFWLQAPSRNTGMVNGLAHYVERVEAIGNGQIPCVASLAWKILGA